MASILYRLGATGATGVKNAALTNAEIDTNFYNLNADIQTRVLTTDYSDAGVLAKVKNVDGSGSGLDADLLDGLNTSSSDQSGNSVVTRSSGNFSANVITANLVNAGVYVGPSQNVTFEGPTDNTYETVLTVNDPTADRTIALPDVSGTVVTTGDTGTVTNAMLSGSIANTKLANSSISIDGNSVSLGGSLSLGLGTQTGNNLWTGQQTFRDNKFAITDDVDTTKVLNFQVSNIGSGTTKTLTAPNANGTIATQEYVQTAPVAGVGQNSQGTKYISTNAPGATGVSGDIWYRI
jgi:hypothetical protein